MHDQLIILILVIVVSLIFDYTNGAHDSANAIATVVSTKALSPRNAVLMAAVLNFVGAMAGTKVAHTIGSGIVRPEMITGSQGIVLAALFGAITWNLLTWYFGLPSSSSHALIGGLVGAAITHGGWSSLNYSNILYKVILPLFLSPLAGMIGGYVLMVSLAWLCFRFHPRKCTNTFRRLQIFSSAFMATSHGLNDAQKTMGIMTLALLLFHQVPVLEIPLWVKLSCAVAMALGTATGGWRIVKTMGQKIFKLEPIHGFAVDTAAALVITAASTVGAPISTTHTISSSVLGVGASKRLSAVRWGIAEHMVIAWILTLPAAALVGSFFLHCFHLLGLVSY